MSADIGAKSPQERLFDLSIDMLCVGGTDGYFKSINQAFERTLGLTAEELLSRPFIEFVHPDDREATLKEVEKLSTGAITLHFENRYRCGNGTYKWLAWTAYPDPEGLLYSVARDITAQKATEENLSRTNALLRALNRAQSRFIEGTDRRDLFSGLLDSLLDLTESEYGFIGEILYTEEGRPYLKTQAITNIAWDDESRALYDRTADTGMEFYNMNTLFGRVITEGRPIISNDPAHDSRAGGLPHGHPELRAFAGMPFFKGKDLLGMVGLANRPDGYGLGLVEFLQPYLTACAGLLEGLRNRTRREQAERALDRISRLDDLTGLPNRRAFLERLEVEIKRAERYQSPLSLLAVDLDHFKALNETNGHAAGDDVLRGVAQILQSECRGTDFAGRLGGEEFVVFLTQTDKESTANAAERIRKRVAEKLFFGVDNRRFHATCSIGFATAGDHVKDADALLSAADRRLREAKHQGRNCVRG
jgi:diguanylate cyclase (GGDEF)-like protein/PAS domain S-box-containing protein